MQSYEQQYLLVFRSHNQASYFYNKLTEQGLRVELIATPAVIANSCSKSIMFPQLYLNKVLEELEKYSFSLIGIYRIEIQGFNRNFILI